VINTCLLSSEDWLLFFYFLALQYDITAKVWKIKSYLPNNTASHPGRPESGHITLGKTRYPLYRRLGGPQGQSGQVRKIPPPPWFFFNASFVRILYFVVLVLDLGPLGRGDHLSVLSLVWADVLYPRHHELPSFAREDAAYWPDTQRTLLAKEGTNGIWPAIVLFYMPQSWDMGQIILLPPEGRHAVGFFSRKNPMASVGSELAILGTRGQHANH
jgi:hypothetical protein